MMRPHSGTETFPNPLAALAFLPSTGFFLLGGRAKSEIGMLRVQPAISILGLPKPAAQDHLHEAQQGEAQGGTDVGLSTALNVVLQVPPATSSP